MLASSVPESRRANPPTVMPRRGTLEPLMSSMLLSCVMEYVCRGDELLSLMLVNKVFHDAAKRFAYYIEVPSSILATRPPTWMSGRPLTLWLNDLLVFNRRLRGARERERQVTPDDEAAARPPTTLATILRVSQPDFILSPTGLLVTNTTGTGYDSDGYSHHFQLTTSHLPFTVENMDLFSTVQHLTICNFAGALELLLSLWTNATASPPATPTTSAAPSQEVISSEKPSQGLLRLRYLRLIQCLVSEAALSKAIDSPHCPMVFLVDGPFSANPGSISAHRSPSRPSPELSPTRLCRCRQLSVQSLQSISPLPALGVLHFRTSVLEAVEPSSWYMLRCSVLRTLHIENVVCDPNRASLDLDFSTWSSLLQCYVGGCESVTALLPSPVMEWLHLHRCTLHHRGTFKAPQCRVLLSCCVGMSPKLEFSCKQLQAFQWSGKTFKIV